MSRHSVPSAAAAGWAAVEAKLSKRAGRRGTPMGMCSFCQGRARQIRPPWRMLPTRHRRRAQHRAPSIREGAPRQPESWRDQ
eukprot:gene6708-110_t